MKTIKLIIPLLLLTACGKENTKYDATGTFEATEVIVSSETQGKILWLNAEEGTQLIAGEQVGVTDTVQFYLKTLQLGANRKSVESQRPNIQKQIAATKQQIATAEKERRRTANLIKANAANQKQMDDWDAQLALLKKQLTAQISSLQNSNNSLTQQSSAVDIERAQVMDQLRKCHFTSPINGTILEKYAEAGELATPGKALFKIADIQKIFLRAYVTSSQLRQIKLGKKVTIFADYGDNQHKAYPGIITWISSQSEFTPKTILTKDERANLVYAIKIAVNNDGYLKIGMYGEVKL